MFNFRTAAIAATMGFAVVATPALAQGTCEYGQPILVTLGGGQEHLTNQEAVRRAVASSQGQQLLANAPAECRSFVVSESLRISGLDPNAQLAPNTTVRIAIPAVYNPPVATPQPPVNSGGSQEARSGGEAALGAQIDRQIADHERRITALEAGGGNSAEIAALRAEVASLRTQATRSARTNRDSAATRFQRTVTRPGASAAEIAAATTALRQAEEKLAEMRQLETATKASADAAAASAASAAQSESGAGDHASDAAGSATTAKSEADRSVAAADRAEAADGWSLWDWLVAALALLSAIGVGLLFWLKASKKQMNEGFTNIERQFETVDADLRVDPDSLEGIKQMPEGQEGFCKIIIDGDDYGLMVTKDAGDCVTFNQKVGAVEVGTPVSIRKLQSTLRKAFRDYPDSFASLKIV